MSKRNLTIIGFMLFSLFFGAGNLIFPPFLGMEAGDLFTSAIAGFILTAVFTPFLAVLSISLSNNGLLEIGQRVSPLFGLIFAVMVYLSIGALYGIPRAASVAYELGFVQVIRIENDFSLFMFTVIFFGLTYILSIDPRKMVDHIGKILTPALLVVLALLFIRAFMTLQYHPHPATAKFQDAPFVTGILEGYFTMDAIAALAFGIVIIHSLKMSGIHKKKDLIRGTTIAGLISAIGLTVVYLSLGWIGRVLPINEEVGNGADILVLAAKQLFGFGGSILFGMIVLLACLTTCIGLTNACATFFEEIFPKISYKIYVLIFVLIGLTITNLGLNTILAIATPILVFIYPFAIVLIILSLIQSLIGESRLMYVFAIIVTAIFAIQSTLSFFKISTEMLDKMFVFLPLYSHGLGWVIPAFIAATLGYLLDKINKRIA